MRLAAFVSEIQYDNQTAKNNDVSTFLRFNKANHLRNFTVCRFIEQNCSCIVFVAICRCDFVEQLRIGHRKNCCRESNCLAKGVTGRYFSYGYCVNCGCNVLKFICFYKEVFYILRVVIN